MDIPTFEDIDRIITKLRKTNCIEELNIYSSKTPPAPNVTFSQELHNALPPLMPIVSTNWIKDYCPCCGRDTYADVKPNPNSRIYHIEPLCVWYWQHIIRAITIEPEPYFTAKTNTGEICWGVYCTNEDFEDLPPAS